MKKRAFTLVEIMIVVAIIALLATIAAPNLLRARINANESTAISALRTIHSCAIGFRAVNAAYPQNLATLTSTAPPYIDATLGAGSKNGYSFTLAGGKANSFTAAAKPAVYQVTGVRSFFIDESGVLRWTDADTMQEATNKYNQEYVPAYQEQHDALYAQIPKSSPQTRSEYDAWVRRISAQRLGVSDQDVAVPAVGFASYEMYVREFQRAQNQRIEQAIVQQIGPLLTQDEFTADYNLNKGITGYPELTGKNTE